MVVACGSRTGLLAGAAAESADASPGNDAPGPSPCANGASAVLATGQLQAQGVALDATNVYWATDGRAFDGNGTVVTVPKCGGVPLTLATGQQPGWAVAVDDANVYWTIVPAGDIGNGAIVSEPKTGGAIVTLASGVYDPLYLALDATDVYWTSPVADLVAKVPKAGGPVTTLATTQPNPHEIVVSGGTIVWLDVGAEGGPGTVMSMPVAGGTPVSLAAGDFPAGLAVGAGSVFWANLDPGGSPLQRLVAAPLPLGSRGFSTLATVPRSVTALATDGQSLYFADIGNGQRLAGLLGRVPVQGGAVTTLASPSSGPSGVAVDDTSVYWLEDTGSVMKGPK